MATPKQTSLLDRTRQVICPTVIPAGFTGPEQYDLTTQAARRLLDLSGGASVTLYLGTAAYPGFDPFPAVTAYAGPHYLATVADRWPTLEAANAGRRDLEQALLDLKGADLIAAQAAQQAAA